MHRHMLQFLTHIFHTLPPFKVGQGRVILPPLRGPRKIFDFWGALVGRAGVGPVFSFSFFSSPVADPRLSSLPRRSREATRCTPRCRDSTSSTRATWAPTKRHSTTTTTPRRPTNAISSPKPIPTSRKVSAMWATTCVSTAIAYMPSSTAPTSLR